MMIFSFFEDTGVVHEGHVFDVCCVVSEVCRAPTSVAKGIKSPFRVVGGGVCVAEVLLEGLVEVVRGVVPTFDGFSGGGRYSFQSRKDSHAIPSSLAIPLGGPV